MYSESLKRAARIHLMIFDVDGVLTDGGLYFGSDGESLKRFHVQDGLGIQLLQESGVKTAIITARQSEIVARRANDLGIHHVKQGANDKLAAFQELLEETGLNASACGYAGDDILDLPVLTQVGFAVSVANGHRAVKSRAHYVSQLSGGNGAVREICDLILQAQGSYGTTLAKYLS